MKLSLINNFFYNGASNMTFSWQFISVTVFLEIMEILAETL